MVMQPQMARKSDFTRVAVRLKNARLRATRPRADHAADDASRIEVSTRFCVTKTHQKTADETSRRRRAQLFIAEPML